MKMTPLFAKVFVPVALLTGLAGSSLAQSQPFSFSTGYNNNSTNSGLLPILNVDGSTPAGEVTYNNFDNGAPGTVSSPSISTTSPVYTTAGRDVEEDSTSNNSGPFRAVQGGFYVPVGLGIRLTSLTFDVYVRGASSTVNPFLDASGALVGKGFYAIFSGNPNTAGNTTPISGGFTNNVLTSTPTFVGYRIAPGGMSTDTSRPIYEVTLDLSSSSELFSNSAPYFFGVSLDEAPGMGFLDANIVIANATDTTTGQPTTTGHNTDGDGVTFNTATGYVTDQPNGINTPARDGFAMSFTGAADAVPEPNSLLFVFGAVPLAATALALRRRVLRQPI